MVNQGSKSNCASGEGWALSPLLISSQLRILHPRRTTAALQQFHNIVHWIRLHARLLLHTHSDASLLANTHANDALVDRRDGVLTHDELLLSFDSRCSPEPVSEVADMSARTISPRRTFSLLGHFCFCKVFVLKLILPLASTYDIIAKVRKNPTRKSIDAMVFKRRVHCNRAANS